MLPCLGTGFGQTGGTILRSTGHRIPPQQALVVEPPHLPCGKRPSMPPRRRWPRGGKSEAPGRNQSSCPVVRLPTRSPWSVRERILPASPPPSCLCHAHVFELSCLPLHSPPPRCSHRTRDRLWPFGIIAWRLPPAVLCSTSWSNESAFPPAPAPPQPPPDGSAQSCSRIDH